VAAAAAAPRKVRRPVFIAGASPLLPF